MTLYLYLSKKFKKMYEKRDGLFWLLSDKFVHLSDQFKRIAWEVDCLYFNNLQLARFEIEFA